MKSIVLFILLMTLFEADAAGQSIILKNNFLHLEWENSSGGYHLTKVDASANGKTISWPTSSGEFTLLYSATKPDSIPLTSLLQGDEKSFPGKEYKYIIDTWKENLKPVPMNRAGQAFNFFPSKATQTNNGIEFSHSLAVAHIQSTWQLDANYSTDIIVKLILTARSDGYYSLATPTLGTIAESELSWGILPGFFQGHALQHNLVLGYAYGQGIPDEPIVVRERTATTLAPVLALKNGLALGLIPEPGTSRVPWTGKTNTHKEWKLGLSLMNRKAALTPTAYHPVLGEKGSYLKTGEQVSFSFRYSLQVADWYTVYKHAIYDIYHLKDFYGLKKTKQSLTDRILKMHQYVVDDSTSMWRVEAFNNSKIGAQAYLGGVVGSDKDAMKNSDYGAIWMLASVSDDPVLKQTRLPYARNFKLAQQQAAAGFFQGAAIGQYYLSKSKKFVEEWGSYVEPIALTYYSMLDMGNILLFTPEDKQLKDRLRLGADRLLTWQHADGSWEVAYDRATEAATFKGLKDYRPTFYGLMVAHRILGDQKYLTAAIKGADWFIQQSAANGYFLGVCGDTRFAPDFATGQSAQALLDLHDLTKEKKYQQAALDIARLYTASIYTHPIPSHTKVNVKGVEKEDWEISQVGLSFEHGGSVGSANGSGPILLASHAGLFVRLFALTKDSLFLDMARAAAWGRDAFVDTKTSVASYYWNAMNKGAGPYPHHAWWQIGWLTDYLLAEIEVRSKGQISFPQGFITPKVGPHKSYGFAAGEIFGTKAMLLLKQGMIKIEDTYVDYFAAKATSSNQIFLMLMNDDDEKRKTEIVINEEVLRPEKKAQIKNVIILNEKGVALAQQKESKLSVDFPAFGLRIIKIEYE
jgi:hypothetical protein